MGFFHGLVLLFSCFWLFFGGICCMVVCVGCCALAGFWLFIVLC